MHSFTFNHIALSVKNVDDSVNFYQQVFQIKKIQNTASESKTRWLSLESGIQIHLIPRPDAIIKTNKAVHFAVSTPDLDAVIEHLGALDIIFSDWLDVPNQVYIRNDGIKQIYFQDPDGYWIEVNDDC